MPPVGRAGVDGSNKVETTADPVVVQQRVRQPLAWHATYPGSSRACAERRAGAPLTLNATGFGNGEHAHCGTTQPRDAQFVSLPPAAAAADSRTLGCRRREGFSAARRQDRMMHMVDPNVALLKECQKLLTYVPAVGRTPRRRQDGSDAAKTTHAARGSSRAPRGCISWRLRRVHRTSRARAILLS